MSAHGLRGRGILAVGIVMLIALGAIVPAATANASPSAHASTGGVLSDSGQSAVEDLRVCLASQSTLNVYYLVDSSLSLARADGGPAGSGSDPDNIRASILGNGLAQLGTIADDVTVNWAAGFFSSEYQAAIPWQAWDDGSPVSLRSAIEAKEPGGYTN